MLCDQRLCARRGPRAMATDNISQFETSSQDVLACKLRLTKKPAGHQADDIIRLAHPC